MRRAFADHLGNSYPSKKALCEHYGVSTSVFDRRFYKERMTLEEALTTPVIGSRRRKSKTHRREQTASYYEKMIQEAQERSEPNKEEEYFVDLSREEYNEVAMIYQRLPYIRNGCVIRKLVYRGKSEKEYYLCDIKGTEEILSFQEFIKLSDEVRHNGSWHTESYRKRMAASSSR